MFINLVSSEQDCFNARRSPRMVGDVLNWSLSRARCFASGLCVFPGDEGGGGVFSTVES